MGVAGQEATKIGTKVELMVRHPEIPAGMPVLITNIQAAVLDKVPTWLESEAPKLLYPWAGAQKELYLPPMDPGFALPYWNQAAGLAGRMGLAGVLPMVRGDLLKIAEVLWKVDVLKEGQVPTPALAGEVAGWCLRRRVKGAPGALPDSLVGVINTEIMVATISGHVKQGVMRELEKLALEPGLTIKEKMQKVKTAGVRCGAWNENGRLNVGLKVGWPGIWGGN